MATTQDITLQCETCELIFVEMNAFLRHKCMSGGQNSEMSTVDEASTSSCSSSGPAFWSENATKILLKEVKERKELVDKGRMTKRRMWQEISEVIKQQGYRFTWEQCQGRMKTLETNLKKTKDHNGKSGNDRKTCAYMAELEDLYEGNPSIRPVNTSGTSIFKKGKGTKGSDTGTSTSCSLISVGDSDEEELKKAPVKRSIAANDIVSDEEECQKAPVKRKSKSAANDVVGFLKDYSEKQTEERNKRLKEKREMHDEKMNLFREFVNALKK